MPYTLDHIDGDRSNNNITNLRRVTLSQNMLNRRPQVKPTPKPWNKLTITLGER